MSDSDPNRPPQGLEQPSAARVLRSLIPNLVINGGFPVLLYVVLTGLRAQRRGQAQQSAAENKEG